MKCKNCKVKFIQKRFLVPFCLQNNECIAAFRIFAKEATEKANAKKWQKEKKVIKESLKTLTDLEKEAKVFFQHWIRIRDVDYGCISCPTTNTNLWDGGHYKKAELYSGTIFNENNCHKQCRKCNRFLGGNELNYREGLISRYGQEYVVKIEELANETKNYKYSKTELIEIKNKYAKLISESKKLKV